VSKKHPQNDLPHVDADGFVEINGERWGTVSAFAKMLGLSSPKVQTGICVGTSQRRCMTPQRTIVLVYREVEIRANVTPSVEDPKE
jgi:hypothetical protein